MQAHGATRYVEEQALGATRYGEEECWQHNSRRSLAGGTVSRFHFSLITEFDLATSLMITPRLTISVGHFQLGAHAMTQERGNIYPSVWL